MIKMKSSGVEWIGEIPDGCEVSKIGQLYEECRTKEPLSIEYYQIALDKIFGNLDISADNWIRRIKYSLYSSEAGYSLVAKELQKNCYLNE